MAAGFAGTGTTLVRAVLQSRNWVTMKLS